MKPSSRKSSQLVSSCFLASSALASSSAAKPRLRSEMASPSWERCSRWRRIPVGEFAGARVVALDEGESTEVDDRDGLTPRSFPSSRREVPALLEEAARSLVGAALLGDEAEVVQEPARRHGLSSMRRKSSNALPRHAPRPARRRPGPRRATAAPSRTVARTASKPSTGSARTLLNHCRPSERRPRTHQNRQRNAASRSASSA